MFLQKATAPKPEQTRALLDVFFFFSAYFKLRLLKIHKEIKIDSSWVAIIRFYNWNEPEIEMF